MSLIWRTEHRIVRPTYALLELVRDDFSPDTIDLAPPWPSAARRLGLVARPCRPDALLRGDTLPSYYVESVWFASLGYGEVFWKTLGFQSAVFAAFAAATLSILFGGFARSSRRSSGPADPAPSSMVNGRPGAAASVVRCCDSWLSPDRRSSP